MSEWLRCPGCGREYELLPHLRGRKVRCTCGRTIALSSDGPTELEFLDDAAPGSPVTVRRFPPVGWWRRGCVFWFFFLVNAFVGTTFLIVGWRANSRQLTNANGP